MHWAWDAWPYALAALAAALWLPLSSQKPRYFLIAFAAGVVANLAVDQLCLYLVPVDIAGTPPPDPRNVIMRLQITAGAQVPACLLATYLLSRWWRRSAVPARRT